MGHGIPRAVRTAFTALAASACATIAPGVISAQTTAKDSVAVGARIAAYRTAWNTHEPSSVAAFFADDADFVLGNRPAAVGRQAIQEWWRDYFANQEPERGLTIDLRSVRFVALDVAVIDVLTTTGGRDRRGQDLPARTFRGTWVVHRQSGEWMISAMRGLPTEEDRVVLNASLAATEALRPGIRAFVDAYEDAINSHDPSAVSAFYEDDADLIVRNGPVTHGRKAIQDRWQRFFSEPRSYRTILITDGIRMITPDVALINVVVTGATVQTEARELPVRYGRATWVIVRGDDQWLITAQRVLPSEDDRLGRGGER
jgi:uncharacterized protein (TIGR02246 family)